MLEVPVMEHSESKITLDVFGSDDKLGAMIVVIVIVNVSAFALLRSRWAEGMGGESCWTDTVVSIIIWSAGKRCDRSSITWCSCSCR